jgi:hypothetical protein
MINGDFAEDFGIGEEITGWTVTPGQWWVHDSHLTASYNFSNCQAIGEIEGLETGKKYTVSFTLLRSSSLFIFAAGHTLMALPGEDDSVEGQESYLAGDYSFEITYIGETTTGSFTIITFNDFAIDNIVIELIPEVETTITTEVTDVSNTLILSTPAVLVTGQNYNTESKMITSYQEETIQNTVLKIDTNDFKNTKELYFIGDVTIKLTSIYPLKTYSSFPQNIFVGPPTFNYQQNKSEIRYSINGKNPTMSSPLYKEPLTFHHNVSGSDNIVLKYRVYYKGKTSEIGKIILNIKKQTDAFYS